MCMTGSKLGWANHFFQSHLVFPFLLIWRRTGRQKRDSYLQHGWLMTLGQKKLFHKNTLISGRMTDSTVFALIWQQSIIQRFSLNQSCLINGKQTHVKEFVTATKCFQVSNEQINICRRVVIQNLEKTANFLFNFKWVCIGHCAKCSLILFLHIFDDRPAQMSTFFFVSFQGVFCQILHFPVQLVSLFLSRRTLFNFNHFSVMSTRILALDQYYVMSTKKENRIRPLAKVKC